MIFKFASYAPMIVCACANVSEAKLRAVIADGATTRKEIARRCGAGAGCGACRPLIRECLRECRAEAAAASVEITPAIAPELVPA
jgi:bacterioferritin-associated ferredoxin